jgi:hypothetical protein
MRRLSALVPVLLVPALVLGPLPPASAAPAQDGGSPPARAEGLVALGKEALDRPIEAALGWMKFMAAGWRDSDEHLGNGESPEAEIILGEAIEAAVKALVESLPGKKGKVRLNDALEGPVAGVVDGGIVLQVNKADTLVPWAEIDPAKLAILLARIKPTAEPDVAALATLRLLGGDPADAKKQSGKLAGDFGAKLKELLEDWKATGPELAAARTLDSILREKDPAKSIERFEAIWASLSGTKTASTFAAALREQFVLRGIDALAGDAALRTAVHGKFTKVPARAHPAAGPGGVGLEIEFEFEKDAEGGDFDPGALNQRLLGVMRSTGGFSRAKPVAFLVDQSRLVAAEPCGGVLPIEFAGDLELEVNGGLSEMARGGNVGFLGAGFTTADGGQVFLMQSFSILEVLGGTKGGPSMEKKIEKLGPGDTFAVTMKLAGGLLTFTRNGEQFDPKLKVTAEAPLRPFVLAGPGCQWFVERLVVRGTATRAGLEALARVMAEKKATALFGT